MSILTLLIALPALFALLCAFVPNGRAAKSLATVGAIVTFVASLFLLGYDPPALNATAPAEAMRQFGFYASHPWIEQFGIGYTVGVDGLSMWLVVLTTFLGVFAAASAGERLLAHQPKQFFAWLLLFEAALIGTFVSLDLVLFYVFFEASLVPMYFLIGIWGGTPKRIGAAVKFFLYTLVGSLVMLVGLIALYLFARNPLGGYGSFDYTEIKSALVTNPLPFAASAAIFGAFAFAFAIKTPLFPFHTWQPDAYAEAPTPAVILMSAVLSKLGTYGFYRFCLPLFPEAARAAAPYFVALGAVAIVYGALVAAMQKDLKRLIAYSSVSHLGFVIVGLFSMTPQGVTGAAYQMIAHGVSTGALFLLIGMLEERRGTRYIRSFGGLWEQMPVFSRVFLVVVLSSIALPLTNGFVGEFLILLGAFQAFPFWAALATSGVIWSAVYMLWMFQRVFMGPVDKVENRRLRDVTFGETVLLLAPFVVLIFVQGIVPTLITRQMAHSVDVTLRDVTPGQERAVYREVAAYAQPGAVGTETPIPVEPDGGPGGPTLLVEPAPEP